MARLKIHCSKCRRPWEVYEYNKNDNRSKICPSCGNRVPGETWQEFILAAFDSMVQSNKELTDLYRNFQTDIFYAVDFIADLNTPSRKKVY